MRDYCEWPCQDRFNSMKTADKCCGKKTPEVPSSRKPACPDRLERLPVGESDVTWVCSRGDNLFQQSPSLKRRNESMGRDSKHKVLFMLPGKPVLCQITLGSGLCHLPYWKAIAPLYQSVQYSFSFPSLH